MKYASAEGNVPYLCPGGDKFIAHSAIYNPSEPRRRGSPLFKPRRCSGVDGGAGRRGGASQGAAVSGEEGDGKTIFVGARFPRRLMAAIKVDWQQQSFAPGSAVRFRCTLFVFACSALLNTFN